MMHEILSIRVCNIIVLMMAGNTFYRIVGMISIWRSGALDVEYPLTVSAEM